MKIYLGVDHGLHGALAAITEDGEVHQFTKMPIVDGKIHCFEVYSWLFENYGDYDQDVIACGEQLGAIFKAAASSTFNFGKNIGKITGIIECLDMEYYEVQARKWQQYIFTKYEIPETHLKKKTPSGKLKTDTKVMAAVAVEKIFGDQYRGLSDGINDALLIARYAMETHK